MKKSLLLFLYLSVSLFPQKNDVTKSTNKIPLNLLTPTRVISETAHLQGSSKMDALYPQAMLTQPQIITPTKNSPYLILPKEITEPAKMYGFYMGSNLAHELGHGVVGKLVGNKIEQIIIGNYQAESPFKYSLRPTRYLPGFEYRPGNIVSTSLVNVGELRPAPRQIPMLLAGPLAGLGASYSLLQYTGEDSPWRYYPHAASVLQLAKRFNVVSFPKIFAATAALKTADDIIVEYMRTKNMKESLQNVRHKTLFDDQKLLSIAATTLFLGNLKTLTGEAGLDIPYALQSLQLPEIPHRKAAIGVVAGGKIVSFAMLGYGIKKFIDRVKEEAEAKNSEPFKK